MARFQRRRLAPKRRKLVWARAIDSFASASNGAADLLLDFKTLYGVTGLPGYTVMRVRGKIQVAYGSGAISDISGVTCGMYVAPSDTVVANVARPVTTPNADWMYWEWLPIAQIQAQDPADTEKVTAYMIDNKSKRKIDELQDTLWFSYNVSVSAITVATLSYQFSVLLALP